MDFPILENAVKTNETFRPDYMSRIKTRYNTPGFNSTLTNGILSPNRNRGSKLKIKIDKNQFNSSRRSILEVSNKTFFIQDWPGSNK